MRRKLLTLLLLPVLGTALVGGTVSSSPVAGGAAEGWRWPVDEAVVVRDWEAPAHRYGPGHRGIDLAVTVGEAVVAPASGVVAFAGRVVDRAVVTIDHGDGVVTTLEPVDAGVAVGSSVLRGDAVGTVSVGGHRREGAVHFGVRVHGEYVNPRLLVGGIPRAVLLPCC